MTAVTLPTSALDELFASEGEQRKLDIVARVRDQLSIPADKSLTWVFLFTYRRYYDSCTLKTRALIRADIKRFREGGGQLPLYFYRCLLPATGSG